MRIVLDTNVLLSGLFTGGLCEAILDAAFESAEHEVISSAYILEEFERQSLRVFKAARVEVLRTVDWLRSHVQMVDPLPVAPDACRDVKDLPILGTALAGKADCIVTGDADLLELRQFRGIAILSPRGLHERLV